MDGEKWDFGEGERWEVGHGGLKGLICSGLDWIGLDFFTCWLYGSYDVASFSFHVLLLFLLAP